MFYSHALHKVLSIYLGTMTTFLSSTYFLTVFCNVLLNYFLIYSFTYSFFIHLFFIDLSVYLFIISITTEHKIWFFIFCLFVSMPVFTCKFACVSIPCYILLFLCLSFCYLLCLIVCLCGCYPEPLILIGKCLYFYWRFWL